MSKAVRIWLIVAIVLTVGGAGVFAGAMTALDWDFSKLSTESYVENTYIPEGEFDKISVSVDTTKIELVFAEGECRAECYESEKAKHSVTVENGTLVIKFIDTRKWYDYIGIFSHSPRLTLYLPEREYASLMVETDTGDVTIPEGFSFGSVRLEGDTADLECTSLVAEGVFVELSTGDIDMDKITATEISLETSTGDISIKDATVKEKMKVETDTGDVEIVDGTLCDLSVLSNTGNVRLEDSRAVSISVVTDTGDVSFERSDADEIFVNTDTGDVVGTLLSDKVFIAESDTGSISVPKTATGGRCEITTSTGDIKINIVS